MIKQNLEDVRKTVGRHPFPLEVIVEVASYCNLSCPMCPQKNLTRKRGFMSNDLFRGIVNEMAEVSPTSRLWPAIMGEPLMDAGIFEKMRMACEKSIHVCFNTNAYYLNKIAAKTLVDIGVKEFYIGLDAITENTYNKVRPDGNYYTSLKNTVRLIDIAHDSGAKVYAQFIDMEENEAERDEFIRFWTGVGAIVKVRPKLGWGLGVETKSLTVPDSERDFPCPWITRTLSVHWNGAVVQCDADWDDKDVVGDANTQSLKQIWDGALASRRDRHWKLDFDFGNCNKCKDWQAGKSYYFYPAV